MRSVKKVSNTNTAEFYLTWVKLIYTCSWELSIIHYHERNPNWSGRGKEGKGGSVEYIEIHDLRQRVDKPFHIMGSFPESEIGFNPGRRLKFHPWFLEN